MYFKVLWGMGLITTESTFIYLFNIILIISKNIHNYPKQLGSPFSANQHHSILQIAYLSVNILAHESSSIN
jgi:hypothetical protein